jgi:hypothetical protein
MRKLLLIGLIALTATAFTQMKTSQNDNIECKYGQCLKIKSDGYQCKNCAQEGSSYCWSHKPQY